jgi:hypothetical protein
MGERSHFPAEIKKTVCAHGNVRLEQFCAGRQGKNSLKPCIVGNHYGFEPEAANDTV